MDFYFISLVEILRCFSFMKQHQTNELGKVAKLVYKIIEIL